MDVNMKSDELRNRADNCLELKEFASTEAGRNRFERMALSWKSLARTQDWLDGARQREPNSGRSS